MSTVRTGPLLGLICQTVLLGVLAVMIGLGPAGWLTGLGYGVVVCVGLTRGLRGSGDRRLGPADRVTLARATLVGLVTALVADSFTRPIHVGLMVGIATVALALDAVDGPVARRTGTVSALGARFDMEVDAYLILVLSVYLTPAVGAWVLAIGVMRYALLVGAWAVPWLARPLPRRYWRKVVAATQGIVLAFAAAALVPRVVLVLALVAALGLLVESFGRDVLWLWARRAPLPAASPTAPASVPAPAVFVGPGGRHAVSGRPGRSRLRIGGEPAAPARHARTALAGRSTG